ncbi:cache domain-containing protein [Psychrobacter sp. I-STPA6b]|uniref:HAMP domain-containing protein n=1 Tax=Psychrobacter sp. I-STPA6b TaxID=2585718 RepID=UPI001D0CB21D|nr:cache domain-containing protein [Psychrobacter sp. I-STPA6b]
MKISYKVPLIATSIILVAFAVFSFWQYNTIKKSLLEQSKQSINETSELLGESVGTWLNERVDTMQGMAEILSQDDDIDKADVYRVLNSTRFNDLVSYYYGALDTDGQAISPTWQPEGEWDARTRPWYEVAKSSNKAMMTEPYPDSQDNRLLITVVSQIFQGNQSIGAMGGDIELADIADAVNAVNFNGSGYAYLVNKEGDIISYPDQSLYGKPISELYEGAVPTLTEGFQEAMIDGKKVLTAFYPLDNFTAIDKSWYIGVVVDEAAVLAPANQLGKSAAITAVIAAILSSIIFYLFMLSSLIKPVNALTAQSNEISRGNFTEDVAGIERDDEIGELAKSIQRLQRSLKMAMERLSKR